MSLFWKQNDGHITSLMPNRRVIISERPYILGLQNMKTTCKKSWPVNLIPITVVLIIEMEMRCFNIEI